MFQLDTESRRRLGVRLAELMNEYFDELDRLPVHPPGDAVRENPVPPLTADSSDPLIVLEQTWRMLVARGFHNNSPNYYGLMNPTSTFMGVLGEAMAAALNQQLATPGHSRIGVEIETQLVRWVAGVMGLPEGAGGCFTTGGSEANLTGIRLALVRAFPEADRAGLRALAGQPVFYVSAEAHHSFEKIAALVGLGRDALVWIATDRDWRMNVPALRRQIAADRAAGKLPFCVVGTAGTTSAGIIDPLEAIADVAREEKLWFHVDGAYGGAAAFSPRLRSRLRGIERADSITIDPHKWLSQPLTSGILLAREPALLRQAFRVEARYVPPAGGDLPEYYLSSLLWSRRFNALKLWMTLQAHGTRSLEWLVDRQMELAEYLKAKIEAAPDFRLVAPLDLPILCFRFSPSKTTEAETGKLDALHDEVARRIVASGRAWISTTVLGEDVKAFRVMMISYLTERRHVDAVWQMITETARQLWRP